MHNAHAYTSRLYMCASRVARLSRLTPSLCLTSQCSRELRTVRVRNRAVAVREARVDVHARGAAGLAVEPVRVVLVRGLAVKLQSGPRAAVADAARDHATVLGLAALVHRRQLREKILAVLQDPRLLGLPVDPWLAPFLHTF